MMNVLLVDDEPGAIKTFKYLLDWETFGFQVTGEAANGHEAIEMLKNHHYDLMITDVRMPGISGLDLIAAIRSESNIPIIVVSGFDEFDYVKQCIKFGVKDYLLKPVSEEDVSKLLTQIAQEIHVKKTLNKQLYLGIPAIKDQTLKLWVQGRIHTDQALEQMSLLNIEFNEPCFFCCMLMEMDFHEASNVKMTEKDIEAERFAVRNVVSEVLDRRGYLFEESKERYGILLCHENGHCEPDQYVQLATEIQSSVLRFAKVSLTIGIGQIVDSIKEVESSYYTALMMLDRKFLLGDLSIINSIDLPNDLSKSEMINIRDMKRQFEDVLSQGHLAQVIPLLQEHMEHLITKSAPKSLVQVMILDLFASLVRLEREKVSSLDDALHLSPDEYGRIMKASTIKELFQYAQEKCRDVIQRVEETREPQHTSAIEQVKRIVATEYGSNVSLKNIAEQIFMNSVYLGHLFKSVVGISFNDYLMQVRMEQAKLQLIHSDKKVYMIANEVGYRQLDWFYRKFKEYTGLSAGEFRLQHGKQARKGGIIE
ncbi:response regulator [Paenibacillus sp. Marseille-Q4541]|uniref:response regulator n=1 Tax=Paenibacillus sp. Marseille-Q4541 TaxID=2831522 RepID=UPI001BA66205|nr:response regulator [Paenibacillus sp. Marseille-Q4541]